MDHIDQDAGLYALGMLDEFESANVRHHIAQCVPCMNLVQNAERVIAQFSEHVPQREPSGALRNRIVNALRAKEPARRNHFAFLGGALAGVLAAALVLVPGRIGMQSVLTNDDRALSTLVQSHFNHAAFVATVPGAPSAKVLYGRHAEWLYIVVHDPPRGLQVQMTIGRKRRPLGDLVASGENASILLRDPGMIGDLELVVDGKVVARAHPVLLAK